MEKISINITIWTDLRDIKNGFRRSRIEIKLFLLD